MAYTKNKLMKMKRIELVAIASAAGIEVSEDAIKDEISDYILLMDVQERASSKKPPRVTAPEGVSVRIERIKKASQ